MMPHDKGRASRSSTDAVLLCLCIEFHGKNTFGEKRDLSVECWETIVAGWCVQSLGCGPWVFLGVGGR